MNHTSVSYIFGVQNPHHLNAPKAIQVLHHLMVSAPIKITLISRI